MKNFNGSFDHRLETLEARSLLSAAPDAMLGAPAHEQVVVADASFLNASSDPAAPETAAATNDADVYDFGGAWGTQALGSEVHANADLDGGAVDQEPGGSMRHLTPASLSSVAPKTYGRAAEYQGGEVVITSNMDPVAADSPEAEVNEPAPIVTVPAEQTPVVVAAPEAISVAASTGSSSIVWLDAHGTAKKTDGVVVTDNVVIVSSFLN